MKNLPIDFLNRMKKLLGTEYQYFEKAYQLPHFRGIRWNPLKCEREQFESFFDETLQQAPFSSLSYYAPSSVEHLGRSYLHHAGAFYVQEPSAASAVTVLDPKPGERVMDLCAAPGGKSTQIAALLQGKGLLWSNEVIHKRAQILLSNIERLGVRNAVVSSCDVERLCDRLEGFFDKILVDAPCSGEGMFRKDDRAIEEWSPEHVQACARRQKEILNQAARALNDGGRLVYSTCTFSPEENEEVIIDFLNQHSNFSLEDCGVNWGHPVLEGKARRIYPMDGGEGHFVAALRKNIKAEENRSVSVQAVEKPTPKEAVVFCQGLYLFSRLSPLIKVGEQFVLLPEGLPNLEKLGVLRAGVPLCEEKKDRLEPCHAAFMAARPAELTQTVLLEGNSASTEKFLKGEELEVESSLKGWCGVVADGMTIGFGKASGGRLKNRYPKGLRNN